MISRKADLNPDTFILFCERGQHLLIGFILGVLCGVLWG